MDFTLYWFMFPVSMLVATTAMLSGIGGAALFMPIFLLIFPLLGPEYPLTSPVAAIAVALLTETFGFSSGFVGYYMKRLIDFGLSKAFLVISVPAAITRRLQLAAAQTFGENAEFEARAGATTRHTDDDDIDASLAGTSFRYAAASDDSVYGGYVGANLRVAVQDRMNLLVDFEYGRASGDETQVSGLLGLEITF